MNETKIGLQVPMFHWPGGPDNIGTKLAEIGINYVTFNMPNDHEIEPIEIIGDDIIPQVAGIK